MNDTSYKEVTNSLFEIIEYSLNKRAIGSVLILLYSGIDTMAWLDRDENHEDVLRKDFVNWTKTFMVPGSGLTCKALDLYGARCSILHSHTAESSLSRKKEAHLIFYSIGSHTPHEIQSAFNKNAKYRDFIAIQIEDLINAFRKGLERFEQMLSKNPVVEQRAKKLLITLIV